MSYKIIPTSKLLKELRFLHKKYPSAIKDVDVQFQLLKRNPLQGEALSKEAFPTKSE